MMEDILANGLPIIAMWTAKYGEGGFYVLTSADCGPAFYMDMGKAGAARFVKPKTNVNLTGFSLDECRVFTLGHVYVMEGITPQEQARRAKPAKEMLLGSSVRAATEEKLLGLTVQLERGLESLNRTLSFKGVSKMEKKENPFVGVVCSGDTKEAYVFAEELFEICKGKKVKVILDAFSLIQREIKENSTF